MGRTPEDHLRRDARVRSARHPDLLRGLPLQPLDGGQRRPMAGSRRPAVRSRAARRLLSLRKERRRRAAVLQLEQKAGRHAGLLLMSWSRLFDDPIALPGHRELVTRRSAGAYIAGWR